MINSPYSRACVLAATIKPPFDPRPKSVMPRSISLASRTPTGRNSTPQLRGSGLNGAHLSGPAGLGGIPQYRYPRHARRDLFEQLQPFPADAVFEQEETGDVAARPRQAFDKTSADRIDEIDEH